MFWDNVAGVYDLFADIFNKETHKALIAAVSSRITPDDAVLECACGTGLLTGAIAERCRTLLATDFSANMLKRAKKKYGALPNVTFRQADILHLDEPDGQFDAVIAANVIHLLDEPYKALAELDRVCRSGGTIIVPTYMNRSEQGKTSGFASTVGKAGADFKRQFTFDTYKQFIAAAGYDDVDYAYVTLEDGVLDGGFGEKIARPAPSPCSTSRKKQEKRLRRVFCGAFFTFCIHFLFCRRMSSPKKSSI